MATRENQYACHDLSVWNILISGQNSHLPSQNVFLQSVIYSTKRTIILAWGKSRVFSTDPPFLYRRDNNDCRSLHGTWRTLCMNKHLINKAVGRTQKTSFTLSSISKASICFDFKTNPSSCARKSKQSTSVILQQISLRNLFITHDTEYCEWFVENITWQLVDSLHRNLANGNCPWLGEAGNSNKNNVCKTDSPYF